MKNMDLSTNTWFLENPKIGKIRAAVPGCVHTDLLANKMIPDFYYRDNNEELQWIEKEDWSYSCHFCAAASSRVSLVFEGLDTYAEIYLNGKHIGKADNMFIAHEFDVSDTLQDGENTLEVRFHSPIEAVKHLPEGRAAFTGERVHTRRMQCTYSWDWVARFVTCGIYRPVYLKYAEDMYVSDLYVSTDQLDAFGAQLYCEVTLKNYQTGGLVSLEIVSPDGEVVCKTQIYSAEETIVRRFDIENPQLWYPHGYGAQPLYTIRATVGENRYEQRFGIRTIRILQLKDKEGSAYYQKSLEVKQTPMGQMFDHNQTFSGFQLLVNGKRIFCKGANWVPCEPFPSAETPEKFTKLILLAKEMNLNFLRVWGGGIFENDIFYDLCDQHGILVAQDFLMACAEYPEKEEWFLDALRAESCYIVKKLRNHPCLAWWHGDNENAVNGNDTQVDYCGRNSALKGIADAVYRYDRTRQLLPSSPYGGDTYASLTRGTSHTTNYCSELFQWFVTTDGSDYKRFFEQFVSRFISEEPVLGMATTTTLLKTMTPEDVYEDETERILEYHTKNNPSFVGATIFQSARAMTESILGKFKNGEDKLFKYQYVQYEWVRVVFENIRRNLGYCNGLVFWMFDDCWPAAMGWALIDYYCNPKSGYYSFRRCAKHVISSVTVKDGGYKAYLSNDGDSAQQIACRAYLTEYKDRFTVLDEYDFEVAVDGYSVTEAALPWAFQNDKLVIFEILTQGLEDRSFYKDGSLHIRACNDSRLSFTVVENQVIVRATDYVHAVALDGAVSFAENYFSLMPNEEKSVAFQRGQSTDSAITATGYILE